RRCSCASAAICARTPIPINSPTPSWPPYRGECEGDRAEHRTGAKAIARRGAAGGRRGCGGGDASRGAYGCPCSRTRRILIPAAAVAIDVAHERMIQVDTRSAAAVWADEQVPA